MDTFKKLYNFFGNSRISNDKVPACILFGIKLKNKFLFSNLNFHQTIVNGKFTS